MGKIVDGIVGEIVGKIVCEIVGAESWARPVCWTAKQACPRNISDGKEAEGEEAAAAALGPAAAGRGNGRKQHQERRREGVGEIGPPAPRREPESTLHMLPGENISDPMRIRLTNNRPPPCNQNNSGSWTRMHSPRGANVETESAAKTSRVGGPPPACADSRHETGYGE